MSHTPRGRLVLFAAATLIFVGPDDVVAAGEAEDGEDNSGRVSTRVTSEGQVIAEVQLAARPEAVREVLASAERAHGLATTTVSVKASRDGACERVQLQTRGLFSPFSLETRRCPTSAGWKETLVTSPHFREYWNEWTIREVPGGTRVTFTTRTMPDVSVPESLILSQTRRVLAKLMRSLMAKLGEG